MTFYEGCWLRGRGLRGRGRRAGYAGNSALCSRLLNGLPLFGAAELVKLYNGMSEQLVQYFL